MLDNDGWPPLGVQPAPRQHWQSSVQGYPRQAHTLPQPGSYSDGPPGIVLPIWHGQQPFHAPPAYTHVRPGMFQTHLVQSNPSLPSTPVSEQSPSANLDRFAPVYVPLWMRQVAAAEPARIIRQAPQPGQDGYAFAKAIFPKALYEDIREGKRKAETDIMSTVNLDTGRLEKLDNTAIEPRYASKLLSLQIKEFQARKIELAASTLYNVEISQATAAEGGTSGLFKLEAPEIREGYPMLDVNDIVFLRHLRASPEGGLLWDGVVYLAEVCGIKRSQALVLIQCNSLCGVVRDTPERFIVGFEPQGKHSDLVGLMGVRLGFRKT